MKVFRLIILIPAIFIVMVLTNILITLIFDLYDYFKDFFNVEPRPLSFIFYSFFKSFAVTFAAVVSALLIYPYEKKYPALIIVAIIYLSIYSLESYIFFFHSDDTAFTTKSSISQAAIIIGSIVALGLSWKAVNVKKLKHINKLVEKN